MCYLAHCFLLKTVNEKKFVKKICTKLGDKNEINRGISNNSMFE